MLQKVCPPGTIHQVRPTRVEALPFGWYRGEVPAVGPTPSRNGLRPCGSGLLHDTRCIGEWYGTSIALPAFVDQGKVRCAGFRNTVAPGHRQDVLARTRHPEDSRRRRTRSDVCAGAPRVAAAGTDGIVSPADVLIEGDLRAVHRRGHYQ